MGLKAVIFNIASSWADTKTDKNSNITHYTTNDIFKGYIDLLSISSAMRDDYNTIKVLKKYKSIWIKKIKKTQKKK